MKNNFRLFYIIREDNLEGKINKFAIFKNFATIEKLFNWIQEEENCFDGEYICNWLYITETKNNIIIYESNEIRGDINEK
jgi:hypothetical protein